MLAIISSSAYLLQINCHFPQQGSLCRKGSQQFANQSARQGYQSYYILKKKIKEKPHCTEMYMKLSTQQL